MFCFFSFCCCVFHYCIFLFCDFRYFFCFFLYFRNQHLDRFELKSFVPQFFDFLHDIDRFIGIVAMSKFRSAHFDVQLFFPASKYMCLHPYLSGGIGNHVSDLAHPLPPNIVTVQYFRNYNAKPVKTTASICIESLLMFLDIVPF